MLSFFNINSENTKIKFLKKLKKFYILNYYLLYGHKQINYFDNF